MPFEQGAARVLATSLSLGLAATASATDTLELRPSNRLDESVARPKDQRLPSFLSADRVEGQTDTQTKLEGRATLRQHGLTISADSIVYDQTTDAARAIGRVRVNRAGNVFEGPVLELRLDKFEGFFENPRYEFPRFKAHGEAKRLEFLSEQRSRIHKATYTTCKRDGNPGWMPDWLLSAGTLELDTGTDEGVAKDVLLSFKGVPLLPVPYLSFPISSQRKTGLLPPSVGLGNLNGLEFTQPFYWNIAPNHDATIAPTLMANRGAHLGGEIRYLERDFSGQARLSLMPSDKLRNQNRWGLHTSHRGNFPNSWTDDGLSLLLRLNRVSDDNYWRDFQSTTASVAPGLTQRLLDNQMNLSWRNFGIANDIRLQRWQTQQDPSAPIVPPYDRLPQLRSRYESTAWGNIQLTFDADYTRFESDAKLLQQPNGERLFGRIQASRPWAAPAGYLTPKLQLHATGYRFEEAFQGALEAQRFVPTLSVDSALVFERETTLNGQSLYQTLEPRVFFVNSLTRDQRNLPNYDSGARDFNMATIYQENQFVGNDRISDGRQITLGLTSRFLRARTGAEVMRLSVAQRWRFEDAQVFLPGTLPAEKGVSDLLLGANARLSNLWRLDSSFQVSPNTQRTVRSNIVANYKPGSFRSLSAAYRFQRDSSEQLDLAWQWPMTAIWQKPGDRDAFSTDGKWYSVGRLNYSMRDHRLVDTLLGLEYDAGCWLGRVVVQRTKTGTQTATQNVMLQLEFVGFARLGVNPLQSLRTNIPNYESLRASEPVPSRFSNYD